MTAPPQLHNLPRAMFLQRPPPLKYVCPCLGSIPHSHPIAIFALSRPPRLPSSPNLLLLCGYSLLIAPSAVPLIPICCANCSTWAAHTHFNLPPGSPLSLTDTRLTQ